MREQKESAVELRQEQPETHRDEMDGHRSESVRLVRERIPSRVPSHQAASDEVGSAPATAMPSWPLGSAVRIAFGLIWLVDVYFKWQPSFLNGLLDVMHDGTMGQPSWLMPWFNFSRAIIAVQPTAWAYAIALVETCIAFALILGFARKITYAGGAVWSVLIWATAEGFGRSRPGEIATDIGTAIVYAVAFVALLAVDQCRGTRPYSLDAVIERRVRWWNRIAEMRG